MYRRCVPADIARLYDAIYRDLIADLSQPLHPIAQRLTRLVICARDELEGFGPAVIDDIMVRIDALGHDTVAGEDLLMNFETRLLEQA